MSLNIKKYLRAAVQEDLFSPDENIIKNKALFYRSQLDGKMYGAYFTNSDTDHTELYFKFMLGMVYVVNYFLPGEDDITIKLKLHKATVFDIMDGPRDLQIGRDYYIKKEKQILGPLLLTVDSDPLDLKELLDTKKMYVISTNQIIEILTNQKIAV